MDDFDFSMLVQLTKWELIHVLESIIGSKELVVEQSLMRPLDKIGNMSLLYEHNCKKVQQFHFDRVVSWDPTVSNRVFMVRPRLATVRKICELIKAEPERIYCVIFVDRRQSVCELEFEKQGVFGLVNFFQLNLSFIPLESDLLSLELPQDMSKVDYQALAKGIWQLQSLYGFIPNQFAIGKAASECRSILKTVFEDQGEPAATANQPISHMFLFDRKSDLASVLMTGLTYESMLNDVFAYSCGKITFGEQVNAKLKQKSSGKNVVSLSNSDSIFGTVRNRHITQVFPFLSAKAKSLQNSFDKASSLNKVEEVRNFVSNELRELKQNHKLLELHICACEVLLETNKGAADRLNMEHLIIRKEADSKDVMKHLELALIRQGNPWQILQLACLWSICEDGLSSKHFRNFRDRFLHACGYEYLPVLLGLQLNGLLTEKTTPINLNPVRNIIPGTGKNSFAQVVKNMNLTVDSEAPFDAKTATKPSYIFSDAYLPLIVQILSMNTVDGWNQSKLQKALGPDIPISSTPNPAKLDSRIKKAVLVCFIGGVSFAEIAALRQFAQNNNFRASTSHWMGSGDTECALYDYCKSAASGSSSLVGMELQAKTPNRHDFESEIWRLNNSITKVYKEIEKYWTEERRLESAGLKTEEQQLKALYLGSKDSIKVLETRVKEAHDLLENKQKERRELEDADLTYKDPVRANTMLTQLQNRYNNHRFSNAREEQLIVNEIERAKRNVAKLNKYVPILNDCKRLESEWKEARYQFQNQKKIIWETRDRWKKAHQNLKKIKEPINRLKYHLKELKAQKRVLIAKYNEERSMYNQWIRNHKTRGLNSFPQAMLHETQDDFEPFLEKKRVCQRLISYLNQLSASADTDLPKELLAEVTEVAAQVCANNPRPQLSLDSEDSADDLPPSFAQLNMKVPENSCPKSNKKRINGKKNLKKQTMPITHDIDYYKLFNDIDVMPPKTYADVEDTLIKVKRTLEFYEEQTEIAGNDDEQDLCLSPIPSVISVTGSDMFESPLLSPHSVSSASLFHSESTDGSPEAVSRTNSTQK